jgi:HlyD family secretion protein
VRPKTWVLTGSVVLGALSVAGVVIAMSSAGQATPAARGQQASTVKVEQRALSAMVSLDGTLTYQAQSDGSPFSVINQARGIYTQLPERGQVISQGQVLYRVNDSPVVLLYGSTPSYRSLSVGTTGADVAELNADLVALDYATSAQLSPTSATFGLSTATAVEKLQVALGLSQNGTLNLGQAVFEPNAVRVTTLSAPVGSSTQVGQTVLQATSTTRQVEVAVDASHQSDVAVGDKVTITLPNNQTTPGVVSSVGTVATCPPGSASGASSSTSAAPGTDACSSSGTGNSATPTITVDVTPSDPAVTGTLDQAPVQVTVTTASVPRALVVPVTALLARSGGGYDVEVVDPEGAHHLVAVSLGLFDDADGLVQVTDSKLVAGQAVVVPTT